MDENISADQIPCPECDGRGLNLENHVPCECCLGLGMIPVPNKVRPFSNGEDDIRFTARNCDECSKSDPSFNGNCDIEKALTEAYWGDGFINKSIYSRMGNGSGKCTEFEALNIPFTDDDEVPFEVEKSYV